MLIKSSKINNKHAVSAFTINAMSEAIVVAVNIGTTWCSVRLEAGLESVAYYCGRGAPIVATVPRQEGDWKKCGWYEDQLCISNRSDGCACTSHQE